MLTTKNPADTALPRSTDVLIKTGQVPRLDSRTLLGQGKSVQIEHEGKLYELRVTRLGKLILTA